MPESGPPDPSKSSADEIRAVVSEKTDVASGLDFGESETRPIQHAAEAIEHLTTLVGLKEARASEATSQLAVAEVEQAIGRGLPPDAVLAAGLSSRAISAEQAEQLAWDAARNAEGIYSDELLDELGDDGLDEAVVESSEQLMAAASALAQYETTAKQAEQASEAAFAEQVSNHERSSAALRALQHEIGLSGADMRQHLAQVDAEAEAGILGVAVDLDRLAQNDSELFARALNAISATVRASENEFEGRVVKTNVFARQPDFASGWTFNGQPAGPEQYVPGIDGEKLTADAVRLAQGKGPFESPPKFPASRDVKDGFTVGNRRVSMDDMPLADGTTAKSRLKKELREGRSS